MHQWCVSFLGNILWLLLGGFIPALIYFFFGLLLCVTIIGIPVGVQLLKLGRLCLAPFGTEVVHGEKAVGCVPVALNIIWIVVGAWELALVHLVLAAIAAITIIGIPFAKQHIKLMLMSFAPFGVTLRDYDDAPDSTGNGAARLH